jgi:hypothetical protein
MSHEWTEEDHERAADRLYAVMDLPGYWTEGCGSCTALLEDGSECGFALDPRGRCWVRSRHADGVASPDTDMLG